MNVRIKRASLIVAAVTSLGIISGCAVTEERMAAVESLAQQASSDAAAARGTADAASRAASDAASKASAAQRTADAAQRSSDSANRCCADNSEKIDRMFQDMVKK